MALFAEALHTPSDLFVFRFLLVAVHVTGLAPDRQHRFGHGRAENVAALVGRMREALRYARDHQEAIHHASTVGPVAAEPPT